VIWGAPVALALTLAVRLMLGNAAPFAVIFWTGLVVACGTSVAFARRPMPTRQPA
jgi:hypothetical protein